MAVKFKKGVDLSNQRAINAADPTTGTDVANKQYVDNLVAGLSYKDEVQAASTTNITLTAPGATIDGYTMVAGNRFLAKDQTTASQNGIYVWNGAAAAATRSTDADSTAELNNATVYVTNGTVNSGREYTQATKNPVVGTDPISFVQKTTGVTYTADGNGIELAGGQFALELDGTTLSKSAAGLRIGSGAAGAGLVDASGVLAVGAGTGITVAADAVAVDTAVVLRKYAADCAATTNPQTFTHALGTDVTVQLWEGSERVYADVTKSATSGGQVTVDWGSAPTAGQYRVVVHG